MAAIDKTDELMGRLQSEFVGLQVEQPLTTYVDNTSSTSTPFGTITTGNKIMARGTCKIASIASHSGIIKLKIDDDDQSQTWKTYPTITFEFRYDGWTHGEKWLYPGGAFVDNVWNDIHPKGTIKATVTFQPQMNSKLFLQITVDPDHDDDPGHFVRDRVAPMVINKLDWILENMTGTQVDT